MIVSNSKLIKLLQTQIYCTEILKSDILKNNRANSKPDTDPKRTLVWSPPLESLL